MGKSGMTINTEKLVRNLRRLERDTDTAKLKALRDCCAVFVSTAQKYTPPNMGKKIPGYMYNIPKPVEKASQRDAQHPYRHGTTLQPGKQDAGDPRQLRQYGKAEHRQKARRLPLAEKRLRPLQQRVPKEPPAGRIPAGCAQREEKEKGNAGWQVFLPEPCRPLLYLPEHPHTERYAGLYAHMRGFLTGDEIPASA